MSDDEGGEEVTVGSFVLGQLPNGEWKPCEIVELMDSGNVRVQFEDEQTLELSPDNIQPLEPERFQVGDQVMGYFEAEGAFYPCEIVEVCDSTYIVHFFDTPDQDLYELDETQVMEERVMEEGTPIFAFLESTETWVKGVVSQPTDTGYTVQLNTSKQGELTELSEDNVYPIEVKEDDQVYAWLESTSDPTDGEWSLATLKEITDVGYKVHFNSMPDSQIVALSPDRVRAEGDLMEMMPEDGDDA